MHDHKDIADLLEEVQTIVHGLRDEKADLNDQVLRLESQLSLVKEEKTKEGGNLEQINAQLKQELQETKDRLTREVQETKDRFTRESQEAKAQFSDELQGLQQKLDRFHPELQSLQNALQNVELQNNLLQVELSKKNEEIKSLESRLGAYTSLTSPSSLPVGESIA